MLLSSLFDVFFSLSLVLFLKFFLSADNSFNHVPSRFLFSLILILLMQSIHLLEVKPIVQKFFRPNSNDFILFLDDGVICPSISSTPRPYVTDKGHIPVSAVCFDCKSFKGFFTDHDDQKSIFCEGIFETISPDMTPNLRDCLEPVEQEIEDFWQSNSSLVPVQNQSTEKGIS